METSLHRQLKQLYAGPRAQFEVAWRGYRIDVVDRRRLIEIQHGPLAAIRDKVQAILAEGRRQVVVVKPIVRTKLLVRLAARGGAEVARRRSPKCGRPLDLFDELVHFTRAFPHPRLTLDVPLVDVEELRYPGHGRRRRWRESDFQVEDQRLLAVHETLRLRTCDDLAGLIACPLPEPFDTAHLAASLEVQRWVAQRIAYCFLQMGGVQCVGKRGNARLYAWRRGAA
jgi:hypothetical protein